MATEINFFLNETQTKVPPYNWKELAIELNFDRDKENVSSQVSITDYEFVNENADIINNWITDGLNNGAGIFEGIPFRIEVIRDGITEIPFDGYLDLTQSDIFSKDRCTVRAVENNGIDAFNDRVDSFTYRHLYDTGFISSDNYDWIPYILNSVPNYLEAVTATIGVYVMVKEINDAIQTIIDFIPQLPLYYVFSTYIRLILYIIYLIFLTIALIKLVKAVVLLLIQPVKYHACMSLKTHLDKGAEFLGYSFDCAWLNDGVYQNTYILPEKYYNPINKKEKQILGFTEPSIEQQGFYKGTFGDLIRECKKMFNAKIIVENNVIRMVRVDEIPKPSFKMLDIYNPYQSYNTDEFNANTLITFKVDSTDKNTFQNYLGTSCQVINEPKYVNNSNMVLMKHLQEERIDFALASRKLELTIPEKILDGFLKVFDVVVGVLIKAVNAIITVLNIVITAVNDVIKKLATIGLKLNFKMPLIPKLNPPDFSNKAKNRIGMLMIEKDLIGVNKIFVMDKGGSALYNKVHVNNSTYFSALYLYQNFHYVNSFIPTADKPNANQWIKKRYEKVPFTFNNYLEVKENNSIFTVDGKDALIDSLKWNVWEQHAEISIRENTLYTNNIKETISQSDGK